MPVFREPATKWFAWHPVSCEDTGWRWLRVVWRQKHVVWLDWHPATMTIMHYYANEPGIGFDNRWGGGNEWKTR